jgi:hypothetical protein
MKVLFDATEHGRRGLQPVEPHLGARGVSPLRNARPKRSFTAGRHRAAVRLYVFAPLFFELAAASSVRAASPPTEDECRGAGKRAEQLRSDGNLAAARAGLATCLSTGCSSQQRQDCARQLAAVEAEMPAVVLEAKDEASNNMSGVRVTMDGAPLLDRLDGTAIFVNPGAHHVTFEAPGFRRTETDFEARPRQKTLRVVVFLDSTRSLSLAATALGRREEPSNVARPRRNLGLVLAGAGIGGVAVGTIWAIMSKVTYDHALASECGGDPNGCSAKGTADGRTAHRQAAVATVAFVAAGVLLAGGAALYFTAPRQAGVAVTPTGDHGGSLMVVGKW